MSCSPSQENTDKSEKITIEEIQNLCSLANRSIVNKKLVEGISFLTREECYGYCGRNFAEDLIDLRISKKLENPKYVSEFSYLLIEQKLLNISLSAMMVGDDTGTYEFYPECVEEFSTDKRYIDDRYIGNKEIG